MKTIKSYIVTLRVDVWDETFDHPETWNCMDIAECLITGDAIITEIKEIKGEG